MNAWRARRGSYICACGSNRACLTCSGQPSSCSMGNNPGAALATGRSSEEETMQRLFSVILAAISLAYWAYFGEPACAQSRTAQEQLAVDIYKELVEINTVTATGDTARAAEAMAGRLRTAGFSESDVQVFTPAPRKGNLVARLRGTGVRKPILLLAHLDVIEARREDWSVDPFKLTEKDGYFYGRGTADDKFMAAAFVANLIRYVQEGTGRIETSSLRSTPMRRFSI